MTLLVGLKLVKGLNPKFSVAFVSAMLFISLLSNVYLFGLGQNIAVQKRIIDLELEVDALEDRNSVLETNNTSLAVKVALLEINNAGLSSQLALVQSELNQKVAPKIVTRLGVRDCNWDSTSMRLYISVEVWNVGTATAKNCTLHIILYQGNRVANNAWVELGELTPGSWRDIAANIHYTGSSLTDWSVIPEFS